MLSALATASETVHFDITLQPKQDILFQIYENSPATKIGFGGSRGGAKSHTADDLMIMRRFKYPKTGGLMVMRILDDLNDIHIDPLLARFPILDAWYHRQKKRITFPNGSFIRFISVENLAGLKKRAGRGFVDIMVDQSELFTQEELEFLGTINRYVPVDANDPIQSNLEVVPKMLFTFNPGGIGHGYHKRVFIEKSYEGNENPEDFAFLQAFGWDNAYWCLQSLQRDNLTLEDYHSWNNEKRFKYFIEKSEYGRKLNALPDSKRKAQLLGDFDVFEGQFFSNFRRGHHVIPYNIRPKFATVGGFDYGNHSPLVIAQRDFEGTIVAADECYIERETPTERANDMADFLLDRHLYKLPIMVDTDMDISQVSNVEVAKKPIEIFRKVLAERMGENAPNLIIVNKTSLDANKQYRGSINSAVLDYLRIFKRGDEDYSKLYFSENCRYLIKVVSELIHPEESPNGLDFDNTHPLRHVFDAFKYAFQMIYTPKREVKLTAKEKWEKQRKMVDSLMAAYAANSYDPRKDW